MKLRSFDLNLLVVLEALIAERSVQQAGKRLGLSQSATSHALDRLRNLLGDQLLVRGVSGMEPTPRALRVVDPLRAALQDIERTLTPDTFSPAAAEGGFTIAVEAYGTVVVLPGLVEVLKEAPRIEITVRSGSSDEILAGIDRGTFDLAIGSFGHTPDRFMTCHLLSDEHVCVMRADHPEADGSLSLDKYLAANHLLLSMSSSQVDEVDEALASRGQKRRITMRVPDALAAAIALIRSDMLASLTCGAARMLATTAPLACVALPFSVPAAELKLLWNKRLHHSPDHIWLRRKLVAIATTSNAATLHA
jgi:DNA-binding transcriptional LysR family regulator